ncbi:MAG: hypothetical protein KF763_19915 [Cyclobacteriaceae bacterium]|nr:hypothetical protein [Cyclobacteriaceae bacterium]
MNFLYNGGTELNPTSNVYDLHFRNYDPTLARMNQVDPMATKYASLSPYNFSFNNPITYNDPLGDDAKDNERERTRKEMIEKTWRAIRKPYYSPRPVGDDDLMYGSMFERYGVGTKDFIYDYENNKYVIPVFANGQWGYWQKRRSFDYSSENYDEDGSGTTATLVLLPDLFVPLKHSLSHYRTMANPIVQAMHAGQHKFMEHPFGAGLMFFLTGGPMGGGGGGMLLRLGARQVLATGARAATRLGKPILNATKNYASTITTRTFATNTALSISSQFIVKQDPSQIDYADALISGISGRGLAQIGGGLISGLVDLRGDVGFVNGLDKSSYQLTVDMATGAITGGIGIGITNLPISNEWINTGGFFNTMFGDGINTIFTGN